nr:hypothetical protein [uncultured Desulfuromonas sp.]
MRRSFVLLFSLLFALPGSVFAVPETVSVRITDVTPSSFCVVWMTDVAAEPMVELYADPGMNENITNSFRIEAMPDISAEIAEKARDKGIMKVRVSGLAPTADYYVRTVTIDPKNVSSVGYSTLHHVTTAAYVQLERVQEDGRLRHESNDLLATRVYLRPSDGEDYRGALLILETDDAVSPLSIIAGNGVDSPEGLFDLSNYFDQQGVSLNLSGGENARLSIYRGLTLSTLLHYRTFPVDTGAGSVGTPVKGFFADFNVDGVVDSSDFELFKEHYRAGANDSEFNPDMNLVVAEEDKVTAEDTIDARDFARFASEYGNDSF